MAGIEESEFEQLKMEIGDLRDKISRLEEEDNKINQRININDTRLRERDTINSTLLQAVRIIGTTDASAGIESTHTHNLGRMPTMVFITPKSNGTVYLTSKSSADIKVKGSDSSLDFVAYLLM
ncbi:MAG: hypothetical protein ACTSPI_06725 [Candidatus Heimdallarchaeaceae archaeon]